MPTKKDVVDKILWIAFCDDSLTACPNSRKVSRAIAKGEDLPESSKPGRIIKMLDAKEREVAKTLTAEDFNHRLNLFMEVGTKLGQGFNHVTKPTYKK